MPVAAGRVLCRNTQIPTAAGKTADSSSLTIYSRYEEIVSDARGWRGFERSWLKAVFLSRR